MNLKEDLLHTVPKKTYLEYLKIQLKLRGEKPKEYSWIILTLITLSFFGILVINPTLSTIANIRKQLTDAKDLNERLENKIKTLDNLSLQYNRLADDLPLIAKAVPSDPEVIILFGKIQTLSSESNLYLQRLEMAKVEITKSKEARQQGSFVFSLGAKGTYESLKQFLNRLVKFDRIIGIEDISILRDESETDANIRILQLSARAYFKP